MLNVLFVWTLLLTSLFTLIHRYTLGCYVIYIFQTDCIKIQNYLVRWPVSNFIFEIFGQWMSFGKTIHSSYNFVAALDHMLDSRSIAAVGCRYFDFRHSLFLYWYFHSSVDYFIVKLKKELIEPWKHILSQKLMRLKAISWKLPYGDCWALISCWRKDFKSSQVADWPVCLLIYCIWPLNDFDWVNEPSSFCKIAPRSRPFCIWLFP